MLLSALLMMASSATATATTAMNGGAAVCDTRTGASASAQTPNFPQNFSVVHEATGILWINVTPTLLGGPSDSCVLTLSFNGARYGTALGAGSGTAVAPQTTSTCTVVGGGATCATPASLEVDWTLNFPPTIYLWVDYTITLTAISASTGTSSTTSQTGTMWLWEPSVPSHLPDPGELV